ETSHSSCHVLPTVVLEEPAVMEWDSAPPSLQLWKVQRYGDPSDPSSCVFIMTATVRLDAGVHAKLAGTDVSVPATRTTVPGMVVVRDVTGDWVKSAVYVHPVESTMKLAGLLLKPCQTEMEPGLSHWRNVYPWAGVAVTVTWVPYV